MRRAMASEDRGGLWHRLRSPSLRRLDRHVRHHVLRMTARQYVAWLRVALGVVGLYMKSTKGRCLGCHLAVVCAAPLFATWIDVWEWLAAVAGRDA